MIGHAVTAALAVRSHMDSRTTRRSVDEDVPELDLPPWAFGVVFLDFLIFLPAMLVIGYTLSNLYLTLAMIEDPNPPAYEPLAPDADGMDGPAPQSPQSTTSSLRATNRLLRSIGGWRSNFRGIGCAFVLSLANGVAQSVFDVFTFPWIGTLLASLALVQLSTVWVTVVVSHPSPLPFWRRLPPLRKTFTATWQPILLHWLAQTLAAGVPVLLASLLNLQMWDPKRPHQMPHYNAHAAWKSPIVLLTALTLWALLVVPSQVVLHRVQASLLPPDEDTIIPFDRSFGGAVEPAVLGGQVTIKEAFQTFTRDSWVRLYKLYLKITLISFVVYGLYFGTLLATFMGASPAAH